MLAMIDILYSGKLVDSIVGAEYLQRSLIMVIQKILTYVAKEIKENTNYS